MDISPCSICQRRRFLRWALGGSAIYFAAPGAFAEALEATPRQTEGPFYPDQLPRDTDNDLLVINDRITPAVGEVTHLSGVVRNLQGEPVRNAIVEIWQVDAKGSYIHSRGAARSGERDANFQGFGRFLTGQSGEYYFRTIKPVAYGFRTAHIHVAVNRGEERILTTQCYPRDVLKPDDPVMARTPPDRREALLVDFRPLKGSKAGELRARFDIVIGSTPQDPEENRRSRAPRRAPGLEGRP